MSFMCASSLVVMSRSSAYTAGITSDSAEMGRGVRVPATTSSPCRKGGGQCGDDA